MSFFNWFIKSILNYKVIAYSRFRAITSTIWHVLFVVLIASIPFLTSINIQAINGIEQLQKLMEQDLPTFSIEAGILHTEDNSPFHLQSDELGEIIIDPTETNPEISSPLKKDGITLAYDKAVIIQNGHSQSIPYLLLGTTELSKDQIVKRVHDLQGFLPIFLVIATIFLYVGILGATFLGVTFLAFLGLPLRGKRKNLAYRHLWGMTAHALTLPVIVLFWLDTMVFSVPITFFLLATYALLFFAIRAIPLPKK